jgi:hypothetical protein
MCHTAWMAGLHSMHMSVKYLLATIGIFIVEILIATTFSDIEVIRSYLGDYLVVILLFCVVKTFYDASPLALTLSVFLFACGVEILQYFHLADVLGLHPGSVLSILLGNSFSWVDILMYFLGCLTCYFFSARRSLHLMLPDKS